MKTNQTKIRCTYKKTKVWFLEMSENTAQWWIDSRLRDKANKHMTYEIVK